jgi:hypothetical protein
MNLELNDEQTEALIRELSQIIDGDRYPLSPRIVALMEILGQLRPEPEPGTDAPAPALRAAEQGAIWTATRLTSSGGKVAVRTPGVAQWYWGCLQG